MTCRCYKLAAALLMVHQIDSAYWRESSLFGFPIGVEPFLLLHLPLVLVVLWGHEQVTARTRAGFWMSVAVGAAGITTATIHGALLARGSTQFRTAPSVAVIAATALSGLMLLAATATAPRVMQPAE